MQVPTSEMVRWQNVAGIASGPGSALPTRLGRGDQPGGEATVSLGHWSIPGRNG